MKRILSIALGFSVFATAPAFAAAGYVTGDVDLRAGPDPGYPSVAMLRVGTPVVVEGCVDGWSWCDVATADDRGWVEGDYLQEEYRNRRVLVPEYGVQIGIPIVSFVFDTYWADHYRNRSWYSDRTRWSRVTPRYQPAVARGGSFGSSRGITRGNSRSPQASGRSRVATARSSYRGESTNTAAAKPMQRSAGYANRAASPAKNRVTPVRSNVALASRPTTARHVAQRKTPQKGGSPRPSDKKNRGNNDQH